MRAGLQDTCGKRFTQQHGDLPYGYDHKYVYSHVGYNLKATDLQAAIGRVAAGAPRRRSSRRGARTTPACARPWPRTRTTSCCPARRRRASRAGSASRDRAPGGAVRPPRSGRASSRRAAIDTPAVFAGNLLRQPAYAGAPHRVAGEPRDHRPDRRAVASGSGATPVSAPRRSTTSRRASTSGAERREEGGMSGFWRDRPVLVTGATGLLGSWLVAACWPAGRARRRARARPRAGRAVLHGRRRGGLRTRAAATSRTAADRARAGRARDRRRLPSRRADDRRARASATRSAPSARTSSGTWELLDACRRSGRPTRISSPRPTRPTATSRSCPTTRTIRCRAAIPTTSRRAAPT